MMNRQRSVKDLKRVIRTRLARRRMEHDALMLRVGQLRGILESASEGIVTADGTQTIVMANRAAAEIFRCPVEDLVGAPLATLLPERLRARHLADVAAFGAAESAARRMGRGAELFGRRADGEEFPLEAGISQVHVDGKRLYTVILRDLTEARRISAARIEVEAALREREARQTFLVRLNDRLRALDDPRAIVVEAANLLCEFVGASRAGFGEIDGGAQFVTAGPNFGRGQPALEGRHSAGSPALLQALSGGSTVVHEDIAHDATLSPQEKDAFARLQIGAAVAVPLKQRSDGQAVFFVHSYTARAWTSEEVALFEDVAERIRADIERARAEAEARATTSKLEAALESIADAVFISDAEGNFLDFNSAFAGFHGYASKADCPRRHADYPALFEVYLADGALAPPDQWAVPRALRGEVGRSVEYGLRRKDSGACLTGSYSFGPIRDEAGEIVGAVVTARDISDMKRLHAELRASHAELQHLVDAQDRVQEAERLRIARELHDDLQQGLAAILMEAAAVGQYLDDENDSPARRALAGIERLGEQLIASTRRIVSDLRPQILEDLGLAAALENLAAQFTQRSGIICEVDTTTLRPADEVSAAAAWAGLYRVAQEALTNVNKHAGAKRVRIRLAGNGGQALRLTISDDGIGLPADRRPSPASFGLLGMRERVRAAGGTLHIRSQSGQGTTIEVELPLPTGLDARPHQT